MLQESYPCYLGNEPHAPNRDLEVTDKYSGEVATRVALADAEAIDRGIGLAVGATASMRELAAYQRQAVLQHCVTRFEERAEELAMALCIEAGKPIKDARGEATRLVDTFRIDSVYGLQAGIFTRDLYKARRAWDEPEVGGVVIGDVPSWRVDHMPYGGVKESGLGREGIRFAIEDMTEVRLMVVRTPA